MNENDVMRLLRSLLEGEGAELAEEGGFLRFRVRSGGMIWETACRVCDGAVLFYGRYPFRCREADKARCICGEINRRVVRGALFLSEDGTPVYRCRAETDDVYGAEERITAALRYSAQVMTHYWGLLSGA